MVTFKVGDRLYVKMDSGELRKFVRDADKRWVWRKNRATVTDRDVRLTLGNRVSFLAHADDNIIEGSFHE